MKKILIALTALSLTSCAAVDKIVSAPAPCAASTVDEKTLVIGLQTFDTLLTAVDRLITAKVIVSGSPRALQIANGIGKAKAAFQAASAAQRVCNTTSYLTALSQAQLAIGELHVLIER